MAYSTKWMATRKMSTLLSSENNFFSFIKKPRINYESTSAWHKHSVEEYRCSRPSLVISLSRCALCGEFGFLQGGDSNGIVKCYNKYIILQSYHYHEYHLNNSCTKCPRHYLYPALQGTDERYNWMKLACTKHVINSHAYLLCNQSRHAFRFVCTKRAHDNNLIYWFL